MYPLQQNQHLLGHPAMMSSNLAGISGTGAIWTCLDVSQTKRDAREEKQLQQWGSTKKCLWAVGSRWGSKFQPAERGEKQWPLQRSYHSSIPVSISKNEHALIRNRYYWLILCSCVDIALVIAWLTHCLLILCAITEIQSLLHSVRGLL